MPPVVSLMQAVRYCERGSSAEFWAEPLNAITNAAYVAAALVGWALVRSSRLSNPDRGWLICLIALIASIGVGSAAFHTAPSVLTKLGDVVPIALFVVAALFVALTRVLSMSVPVAFGQLALLGAVSVDRLWRRIVPQWRARLSPSARSVSDDGVRGISCRIRFGDAADTREYGIRRRADGPYARSRGLPARHNRLDRHHRARHLASRHGALRLSRVERPGDRATRHLLIC